MEKLKTLYNMKNFNQNTKFKPRWHFFVFLKYGSLSAPPSGASSQLSSKQREGASLVH